MPGFNGSGVYSRAMDWTDDKAAAIPVTASRMDTEDDTIAAAFNLCLTRDGQSAMTANISAGNNLFTNVANATARTHFASAGQVSDGAITYFGTTGGSANAQTLSPAPAWTAYPLGAVFLAKIGAALTNTATMTIQISGIASPVTVKDVRGNALGGGEVIAGRFYQFYYDGTNIIIINPSTDTLWKKIASVTASASATVSFTGSITSAYNYYECRFRKVIPTTDGATLAAQIGIASTYITANYTGGYLEGALTGSAASAVPITAAASIAIGQNTGSTSPRHLEGEVRIYEPADTALTKFVSFETRTISSAGNYFIWRGFAAYTAANSAVDSLRFIPSATTIASGVFDLYGGI